MDDAGSTADDKFTVATFNVLCKTAATPSQFGYTPLRSLKWDMRKEMILDELRTRNADIVCLQELDHDNYHHCFREELARQDYKGIYWPRGRAKTMRDDQIKVVDGCAIFIKNNK